MDDATRQARERREQAQDFLAANPSAHSVGIDGTVYDCNGYERSPMPPVTLHKQRSIET
jgi:hypothetical protein